MIPVTICREYSVLLRNTPVAPPFWMFIKPDFKMGPPLKTNMDTQNDGLEKVTPFKNRQF